MERGGKIKILNLYAGIGGNRKLWDSLGDFEITAVEYKPEIAKIYQDFFPNDKVIITDAHQYLLEHFSEYHFIWSSPPCPSHSRFRFMTTKMEVKGKSRPIVYPDMKLYEEILLLKYYFKGNDSVYFTDEGVMFQKTEVRSQKPEVRSQESGDREQPLQSPLIKGGGGLSLIKVGMRGLTH